MMPEVIFEYSSVYDGHWRSVTEKSALRRHLQRSYPSPKKTIQYIKNIAPVWKKREKEVLQTLTEITGLKWKRKKIPCYVVGFCRPFSSPLTIRPYKNKNDFIDTLIHELIHNLIAVDNTANSCFKYFEKKYKKNTRFTINHIPVNAILAILYMQMFGKNRLNNIIEFDSKSPEYKHAWEIAKKEGFEKIINKI